MKRLEFKSIAARFGEGIRNESGPEKHFVLVEDFSEADALFEKAKKKSTSVWSFSRRTAP
ncbi:MAG: hypothetical protein ACLUAR_00135 [Pilosibacter sp.]